MFGKRGRSGPRLATNFVAARPAQPWPTHFDWLGASFYRTGYELWCEGHGASFDCRTQDASAPRALRP